MDLIGDMNI